MPLDREEALCCQLCGQLVLRHLITVADESDDQSRLLFRGADMRYGAAIELQEI